GSDDSGAGTADVSASVSDDDGGTGSDTIHVAVANVAPTATFGNDGPVDEGSSFHLSLTSPHDASSDDQAAGFTYAFDCGDGSGYGAFSASASATCPTNDNGVRNVKGKIKDKDGGVSEYTGTVTVNNVAPTVHLSGTNSANEGDTKHYSYSWTDPGSADTFPSHSVGCGVHGTASNSSFDAKSGTGYVCTTVTGVSGIRTAACYEKVSDDDGGTRSDKTHVD